MGQADSGDQLRKSGVFLRGTGETEALRCGMGKGSMLGEEALGAGGCQREVGPEAQA